MALHDDALYKHAHPCHSQHRLNFPNLSLEDATDLLDDMSAQLAKECQESLFLRAQITILSKRAERAEHNAMQAQERASAAESKLCALTELVERSQQESADLMRAGMEALKVEQATATKDLGGLTLTAKEVNGQQDYFLYQQQVAAAAEEKQGALLKVISGVSGAATTHPAEAAGLCHTASGGGGGHPGSEKQLSVEVQLDVKHIGQPAMNGKEPLQALEEDDTDESLTFATGLKAISPNYDSPSFSIITPIRDREKSNRVDETSVRTDLMMHTVSPTTTAAGPPNRRQQRNNMCNSDISKLAAVDIMLLNSPDDVKAKPQHVSGLLIINSSDDVKSKVAAPLPAAPPARLHHQPPCHADYHNHKQSPGEAKCSATQQPSEVAAKSHAVALPLKSNKVLSWLNLETSKGSNKAKPAEIYTDPARRTTAEVIKEEIQSRNSVKMMKSSAAGGTAVKSGAMLLAAARAKRGSGSMPAASSVAPPDYVSMVPAVGGGVPAAPEKMSPITGSSGGTRGTAAAVGKLTMPPAAAQVPLLEPAGVAFYPNSAVVEVKKVAAAAATAVFSVIAPPAVLMRPALEGEVPARPVKMSPKGSAGITAAGDTKLIPVAAQVPLEPGVAFYPHSAANSAVEGKKISTTAAAAAAEAKDQSSTKVTKGQPRPAVPADAFVIGKSVEQTAALGEFLGFKGAGVAGVGGIGSVEKNYSKTAVTKQTAVTTQLSAAAACNEEDAAVKVFEQQRLERLAVYQRPRLKKLSPEDVDPDC
ncbi:hypothetical protein CEUSTIGMA_g4577.t1 [Chlamydomonas eustigma]|uniref:Uncharacterized protein n=1 Tax=Chlamydomonas eustigma TaxID=1157962 RepID=A0A250X234_9CHLO|nr:hypothetical protein CEUSTIGMA_g4577.t1 [Chlamydomonas eustigma]|eukprot:GAX77131.1 hypothetical protein CEUSTIGMA_g4577.t1 [Chlamydomonas eustigma]